MPASTLIDLSDPSLARAHLRDEIARLSDDAEALLFLAQTAVAARLADVAVTAAERALSVFRAGDDREALVVGLLAAGSARALVGDHVDAVRLLMEGRAHAQQRDDATSAALARLKLAHCFAQLHEVERAQEHFDAALPALTAMREPMVDAEVENVRGIIANAVGDYATAEAIKTKLAAKLPSGSDVDAARAKVGLAATIHNGGDRGRARSLLEEAVPVLEGAGDKASLAQALEGLGVIERQEDRPEAAIALYERGARLARDVGENARVARFVLLRGYCLVHLGRNRDAVDAFLRASSLFKRRGETYDQADAEWSLGLALRNLREAKAATEHFAKAAELFWSLEMNENASACEVEIAKLRKPKK